MNQVKGREGTFPKLWKVVHPTLLCNVLKCDLSITLQLYVEVDFGFYLEITNLMLKFK